MRRFKRRATAGRAMIIFLALAAWIIPAGALAQEEYAGSFQFGEASPCDGNIGPGDIAALETELASGSGNYAGCSPAAWDIQDLDGDGTIGPGDIAVLQSWIAGDWNTSDRGKPAIIVASDPSPVIGGNSVQICVSVYDDGSLGEGNTTARAGWGVLFEIDPATTCPAAVLEGLDPTPIPGGGKGQVVQGNSVFAYTGRMPPNGNGEACVKMRASGCIVPDQFHVNTRIPSDGEAMPVTGSKGRFPVRLDGPTIHPGFPPPPPLLSVMPDPAMIYDGETIQLSAIDDIDGDVTVHPNTAWRVLFGACSLDGPGLVSAPEGCSDYSCEVEASYDPGGGPAVGSALIIVTDDDMADTVSLSCNPASDGGPIDCAAGDLSSSADGCDRGPSTCVPLCTSGCSSGNTLDEACADYVYSALCDEGGGVTASDSSAAVNNETVPVSVDVTPDNPASLSDGETLAFDCLASYSDNCAEGCMAGATWTEANAGPAPCGHLSGNVYTGANGSCTEDVVATFKGVSGFETVNIPGPPPPVIAQVFPLSGQGFDQRFSTNAKMGQVLTITLDLGFGGEPTNAQAICESLTDMSTVTFTCDLSGVPADPDIPCTPDFQLNEGDQYQCFIEVSSAGGNDTAMGNMTTALFAAEVDGGMAGGYIGGATYDSATSSVGPGSVNLAVINAHNDSPVLGKVYVQVVQGGTTREYFTDPATGSANMSLDPLPIDYITLGYKCGGVRCPKIEWGATLGEYRSGNAMNFMYHTWRDVDASDLVLPIELMTSARTERYRLSVKGTIDETQFGNYIAPRPPSTSLEKVLVAPVKLRAAFVTTTAMGQNPYDIGIEGLLLAPDYEQSITLCVLPRDDYDYPIIANIPPNLLMPEILRSDWTGGCRSWATNPGKYQWTYHEYDTGLYANLWSVGVYINATRFSLDPQIDFFSMPMYVCALGVRGGSVPSGLSGDTVVHMGSALNFQYDIREDWDNNPLGHDPDTSVDRKALIAVDGHLPADPARRDATLRAGYANRVPNSSDSELFGDDTWDERFHRNEVKFVTGANFGPASGFGITGLNLGEIIDDPEFTLFNVFFIQSQGARMGTRDIMPWRASAANTEVVSDQQANFNSSWADPVGSNIGLTAVDDGGPTNYVVIAALRRGGMIDGNSSDPDNWTGAADIFGFDNLKNPGETYIVSHLGPAEDAGNETISVGDWLNLPEALAPGPDPYLYPAPQWSNTPGQSKAVNRNGELWRIRTAGAGNPVPSDAAGYYFEFSRPSFMNAPGRAVHLWTISLAEPAFKTGKNGASSVGIVRKRGLRAPVADDDGEAVGADVFIDDNARFVSRGVIAGDSLWINSRLYGVYNARLRVVNVDSETQLTVFPEWSAIGLASGSINVRYRVIRQYPRGECASDEYASAGGADNFCRANTFWKASGRAESDTVRAHFPDVTPGAAVLNGDTGIVPDPFDGIPINSELEWNYGFIVFGTGLYQEGGLGGPFDPNNRSFKLDAFSIEAFSRDAAMVYYQ